jgi:CheY-like chemotaxis protein
MGCLRRLLLIADNAIAPNSSSEARDVVGQRNPDLVLVDYRLPEMTTPRADRGETA